MSFGEGSVILARLTVPVNVDTIDLGNLDGNADRMYRLHCLIQNVVGGDINYNISLNAGAVTATATIRMVANSAGVTGGAATTGQIGNSAAVGDTCFSEIVLFARTLPAGFRPFHSISKSSGGGDNWVMTTSGRFSGSLPPLTGIRIEASAPGGIGAASEFTLMRI